MGEGLNVLEAICYGGRLLSLASLVYFLYLMFDLCKVLNVFSSETLHHLVRRAASDGSGSTHGGENTATGTR